MSPHSGRYTLQSRVSKQSHTLHTRTRTDTHAALPPPTRINLRDGSPKSGRDGVVVAECSARRRYGPVYTAQSGIKMEGREAITRRGHARGAAVVRAVRGWGVSVKAHAANGGPAPDVLRTTGRPKPPG